MDKRRTREAGHNIEREYELSGVLSEDCSTIQLDHATVLYRVLRHLVGERLYVKIKKLRQKRSDGQNSWYWGVAIQRIRAWKKDMDGKTYTDGEIHAYNLIRIAGRKPVIKEVMGVEVVVMEGKTTSKMSTVEFNDFKEALQKHYAEMGCDIPDPKERGLLSDYIVQEDYEKVKSRKIGYSKPLSKGIVVDE